MESEKHSAHHHIARIAQEELLDISYNQLRVSSAAVLLNIFVLAYVTHQDAIPAYHYTWIALAIIVTLARYWSVGYYKQYKTAQNIQRFKTIFVAGVVASSSVWGLSALMIFPTEPIDQALHLIIFAGIAAGSVNSLASYKYMVQLFLLFELTPIIIMLFLSGIVEYYLLGVLMIVFTIFISMIERRFHQALYEAIERRVQFEHSLDTLNTHEKRFETIFNGVHTGIFTYDTDLKIIEPNIALSNLLEAPIDFLRGLDLRSLPDSSILPAIEDAIKGNKGLYEGKYKTKYIGKDMWLNIQTSPITDSSNTIVGGIGIVVDIGEQKMIEQTLREAKTSAELASKSKGEFLANMSHEIRTPLNAIIGLGSLALDRTSDQTTSNYLKKILSSSKSLLAILNDILDYSKLEARKITITKESVDLQGLVDEMKDIFEESAKEKGIELAIEVDGFVPPYFEADGLRLKQILINLLSNAIKFTKNGSVTLSISKVVSRSKEPKLRFEIIDSGIGMNAQQVSRLFKPFSQVDTSITREFGGTGLGLSISMQLAKLMGSKIEVISEVGSGSIFFFLLPTKELEAPKKRGEERLLDELELIKGAKVLVVEDNEINQEVLLHILEKLGLVVTVANNGQEGIEKVLQESFDLIFMDMQMPVMDGIEATKLLRADYHFTSPILAMTAAAQEEHKIACLEAGMDDFLTKPIDIQKLKLKLKHYVQPTRPIV